MHRQPAVHRWQVYGAMMFVDLYGVAAAERDVGAAIPREVREIPSSANGTGGIGSTGGDLGAVIRPQVEGDQRSPHGLRLAGQVLKCFRDLDGR